MASRRRPPRVAAARPILLVGANGYPRSERMLLLPSGFNFAWLVLAAMAWRLQNRPRNFAVSWIVITVMSAFSFVLAAGELVLAWPSFLL